MIRGTGEHVPFSASMVWLPITFTLMILVPGRNIYLAYVILIFICYLLAPVFDKGYNLVKLPFRKIREFVPRKLEISLQPIQVEDLSIDVSRKHYIANALLQSIFLGLGILFIILGVWITHLAFYVDIITGLGIILVFSASFTMGFQLLAVAFSMTLTHQPRTANLNKRLREFTFLTTALVWIFAIWTYLLSWPIDSEPQRQVLVFTSVFISVWATSLIVKQGKGIRIFTDVMIIAGLAISLNAWLSLTNLILILLGSISLCSIVVHLLVVCVHYFDKGPLTSQDDEPPINSEKLTLDATT